MYTHMLCSYVYLMHIHLASNPTVGRVKRLLQN